MNSALDQSLAKEMATWESKGLRRWLPTTGAGADFVSNDYLGLAGHPQIVAAAHAALERYGVGGRAARLLGGGSALDRIVEERAAEWLGTEGALLFPTGYQANLGILTSLVKRGDVVLSDALNHASLIDAARLSRARVGVFAHNDLEHLESLLKRSAPARRRLVVTEGVFGMDGDLAPVREIDELCREYDAWLVVDEAHGIGVVGPAGRGVCARAGLSPDSSRLAARVITGGKALGVTGGIVVASAAVTQHLLNHARSFVFTTATSPAVSGALACAIELVAGADGARERLQSILATLTDGLNLGPSLSPIVPLVVGPAEEALTLAQTLQTAGLDVRAVRPPTVPANTSRLRIVCHADNDPADVEALVALLSARAAASHPPSAQPSRIRPAPLVVTGTDTDVGKTVVSALLTRALAHQGKALYWKPVQTGDDSDTREVRRLCAGLDVQFDAPAFEFPLPASPHEAARAVDREVVPAVIDEGYERLCADHGPPAVIELAGGVLVPWTDQVTQGDWLERRRPPVVLVARSGLGTLNHTLLTLEALQSRGLAPRALFLVGPPHESNRATLAPYVEQVFVVPPFDDLCPASLDAWLADHDLTTTLAPTFNGTP